MPTYQYVAKKYLFEVLQEKYQENEQMITRMTHYLATEQDVRDFVKIIADAFERGYVKAVGDYKKELKKIGYEVNIVAEKL